MFRRYKMFRRFSERFLPIYIRFWPTLYWLAFWSAPVRYDGNESLPSRKDGDWQALRITIRHNECHSKLIFTIKRGII
jgi:hypothetical protein